MAGFKTHITTSSLLGVGYTGVGLTLGIPLDSALIAGGLCGIGGMLPDIDSDSGIPFRESTGFAAAIVPMLLLERFQSLGFNHEHLVLATAGLYLFVRFGVARMLAKYTVHRGMFHSLPAVAIFTGVAFLLCGTSGLQLRYFKAGGVLLGVMSHLILDEIYAIDWKQGRLKKSFGTALKLWGSNWWGNISAYGKLAIVVLMILGEPSVMQRYGQLSPVVLQRKNWAGQFAQQTAGEIYPPGAATPIPETENPNDPAASKRDTTIYDTAQRIWRSLRE